MVGIQSPLKSSLRPILRQHASTSVANEHSTCCASLQYCFAFWRSPWLPKNPEIRFRESARRSTPFSKDRPVEKMACPPELVRLSVEVDTFQKAIQNTGSYFGGNYTNSVPLMASSQKMAARGDWASVYIVPIQ